MRLPDLWRIARIAMALCTREAKFEAVQRHYTTLRLMFDILPQILALYDQHVWLIGIQKQTYETVLLILLWNEFIYLTL